MAALGGIERHDVKRRVLERRRGTALAVGGGVNGAEEGRFAVVERGDERVVPVVERHGKTRGGRAGEALRAHGEERLLAGRLQQADRRGKAKNLAQPLQGVLRTVGDVAPADERFEQAHPGRQQRIVRDGHGSVRHSSSTRRPVALRRGLARDAGGYEPGWQSQP